MEYKMEKRRHNKIPDEVYLVLETAIDGIMDVIENEKEEKIRPNTFHMIGREFQLMLRDKMHEAVVKAREGKRDK